MEEKNAYKLLIDYAKTHRIDFDSNESYKRFYMSPGDPSSSSKFVRFKTEYECIFLAKDSYSAKAYSGSTFSGIYTTIDIEKSLQCKIYRKNRLDFLFLWNRRKTGNNEIDSKLTICSNQKKLPVNFLTEKELALFIELSETIQPIKIIIEYNYLPELLTLKNKMVIGLESNQWMYDSFQMDILLEKGAKLLSNIKQNISKTATVKI